MRKKTGRGGWRGKLKSERAAAMLRDIFEARHDLAALSEAYGLGPGELAAWANDPENREVLQGLCVLADLQTQLMLSRYRQLAVTELIRQATGGAGEDGESAVSAEQSRKACVDLLRADLKPSASGRPGKDAGAVVDDGAADALALRSAIYGKNEDQDSEAGRDA